MGGIQFIKDHPTFSLTKENPFRGKGNVAEGF